MKGSAMEKAFKSQTFFIVLSVLYVVCGIVILFWPNLSVPLLGKVVGIGMLVAGCTHIIIYFTRDHMNSVLHMDLTEGVVFAAFGAFLLMHSDFVEIVLPFAVGILLLIGAMIKVQYALDMRKMHTKHWYLMILFGVILLLIGLCLVYNPFSGTVLLYVIAFSSILEGILNIFCILFVSHRMKQINRGKIPMGPYAPQRKALTAGKNREQEKENDLRSREPSPSKETVVTPDGDIVDVYEAPRSSRQTEDSPGPVIYGYDMSAHASASDVEESEGPSPQETVNGAEAQTDISEEEGIPDAKGTNPFSD